MASPTTDGTSADGTINLNDDSLARDLLALRACVAERLVRGHGGVSVDVSSLKRLSSETVAALLWARRKCRAQGVPFSVSGAGTRNTRILLRCGLQEALMTGASEW